MCRYAMHRYKPHFVCFKCRKTFKRIFFEDIKSGGDNIKEAKCPQCGELMFNIGRDFKAPSKDNIKEWDKIKLLYEVGVTFHTCGCSGPGYIPKSKDEILKKVVSQKAMYLGNLHDAMRKEVNSKELIAEKEECIKFWKERVQKVEKYLEEIKKK